MTIDTQSACRAEAQSRREHSVLPFNQRTKFIDPSPPPTPPPTLLERCAGPQASGCAPLWWGREPLHIAATTDAALRAQGNLDMVPDMVKQFVVYFYRHIRQPSDVRTTTTVLIYART